MSSWSYIKGIVEVSPFGRTQAEYRYILETVLAHLPKVTGSEEDMYTHIVQCAGHNTSSSCNEFGEFSKYKWIETQDNYIIVIEGHFRDREFNQTYKEFMRWLMRLANRVWVDSCLVKINDTWSNKTAIINLNDLYDYVVPYSWEGKGTVNWCEYLMWEYPRDKKGRLLEGKPDFADGKRLDLMSKREREKRLNIKRKNK